MSSVAATPDLQLRMSDTCRATFFFAVLTKILAAHTMDLEIVLTTFELLTLVLKKFPRSREHVDASKFTLSVITAMVIHKRSGQIVNAALSLLRIIGVPAVLLTDRNCRRFAGFLQELLILHGMQQPMIINSICWLIVSLGNPIAQHLDSIYPPRGPQAAL